METFSSVFFKTAVPWLNSNFVCWMTSLLEFALAGEDLTSQALACLIVGKKDEVSDVNFNSEIHQTKINLRDMVAYFEKQVSMAEMHQREFYQLHERAVMEISSGRVSLWNPMDNEDVKEFQEYAAEKWLPLPSNTQFVESGVKEAKMCSSNNWDELLRSMYATVCSSLVEIAK